MVSRQERDKALQIIGPFFRGEAHSVEMEERFTLNNPFWKSVQDPAVRAFASSIGFWDDGEASFLLSERASSLEIELAERWTVFLNSDLEYDWPKTDLSRWRDPWWKNLVALPLLFIVLPIALAVSLGLAIICLPYRLIKKRWPMPASYGKKPEGVMFSDNLEFEAYLRKRMGKRSHGLDLSRWPFHNDVIPSRNGEVRS